MSETRSRLGMLVGVAAAFGVAAMMSTATSPTARADDFSEIIAAVDGDYSAGQTAFGFADSYFAAGNIPDGLADFFTGVDDDTAAASDNLFVGTVEALTNEPITSSSTFGWGPPSSFAEALTSVESYFGEAQSSFTAAAHDLEAQDYGGAAYNDAIGLNLVTFEPIQELLRGASVSF
jgi:hypothetical protein